VPGVRVSRREARDSAPLLTVIPGLEPGIQLHGSGWMAGASPAMTPGSAARNADCPPSPHGRGSYGIFTTFCSAAVFSIGRSLRFRAAIAAPLSSPPNRKMAASV